MLKSVHKRLVIIALHVPLRRDSRQDYIFIDTSPPEENISIRQKTLYVQEIIALLANFDYRVDNVIQLTFHFF